MPIAMSAPIVAQLWQKPGTLVLACRRLERLNQLQCLREDDRHSHVAFRELFDDHGGVRGNPHPPPVLGQQRQRSRSARSLPPPRCPTRNSPQGRRCDPGRRDGCDDLGDELPGDIGSFGGRRRCCSSPVSNVICVLGPSVLEDDLHPAVGITFEHAQRFSKLRQRKNLGDEADSFTRPLATRSIDSGKSSLVAARAATIVGSL